MDGGAHQPGSGLAYSVGLTITADIGRQPRDGRGLGRRAGWTDLPMISWTATLVSRPDGRLTNPNQQNPPTRRDNQLARQGPAPKRSPSATASGHRPKITKDRDWAFCGFSVATALALLLCSEIVLGRSSEGYEAVSRPNYSFLSISPQTKS